LNNRVERKVLFIVAFFLGLPNASPATQLFVATTNKATINNTFLSTLLFKYIINNSPWE
jgi:hypothetical protein